MEASRNEKMRGTQPPNAPLTPGATETHSITTNGTSNPEDDGPACISCRKRKLKCSREHPACTHCTRLGVDCAYDAKKGKPGVRAGVIETLSRRIDALEEKSCEHEGKDTRAIYDILSFFAEEFKKTSYSRQSVLSPRDGNAHEAPTSSPASSFSWRPNPLEPYGSNLASSSVDNPRKRKRVDSCGNPNLPLDISPEELEYLSDQLPSPHLMDAIITVYFRIIQPWIPILHETKFRTNLNDPERISSLVVILHAMVVAALRFVTDSDLSAAEVEQRCRRSRNIVVLNAMDSLTVENLQASIIIVFNDIGSGYASKAWSLVGSLTRTVEYMQLTVEDEDHNRLLKPLFSLGKAQSWTEVEERRRVFWNIFNLDRFCSVTTGWNTSLTADDMHRRLPADGGLWHKEEPVVTPYFNIWDRSAAKIRNSIAFLPADYPSSEGLKDKSSKEAVDMSTVGAFAYCIEATESLSRVTTYFLQQKVNLRDRQEVSIWLTRFKELDLRLVHWKLFLPQKWKDSNISREPARINMDPNLTLAHLTHNTSMILLHQKIAYPSRDWTDIVKLPSFCSAETCQNAAIEISTITQKYLKYTPKDSIASSQFAFCAFVSARVLLVHWRHYGSELVPEFWTLLESLEEMSQRWGGRFSKPMELRDDLAAKYAQQIREFHKRMQSDSHFTVDILGYSNEVPLQPSSPGVVRSHGEHGATPSSSSQPDIMPISRQMNKVPSQTMAVDQGLRPPLDYQRYGFTPAEASKQMHQNLSPGMVSMPETASDDLAVISHSLLGQQFLEMDRVISFDDVDFAVDMLGAPVNGNGWSNGGAANGYTL